MGGNILPDHKIAISGDRREEDATNNTERTHRDDA